MTPGIGQVLKLAYNEFSEDKAPRLGAALAYYTVFSIAPLIIILISAAGLVFGEEAVRGELFKQISTLVGPEGAEFIQGAIASSSDEKKGIIASIIGLVVLLFGATGVFTQLQDALNTVWEVEPENQTFWASLLSRWTSFTMVLGIGFLLLVSLFLSTFLSLVSDAVPPPFGIGTAVLEIVHNVVTLGVITALFAMMYRLLPGVKLPWKDVWLGAALTAFLFVLGKFLLGLYLGKAAVGSSYGAAGTAVVLLVWVYYSSQILLFGAECTQAVAKLRKRKIELRPGYHLTERAAWELEGQPA